MQRTCQAVNEIGRERRAPRVLMSSVALPDACWFLEPDPTAEVGVPRLLEGGRNGYQQARRRQCPERRSPEAHPASKQDHGRKYLDKARQKLRPVHGSEKGAGEEEVQGRPPREGGLMERTGAANRECGITRHDKPIE